jgi:GTP-binding protein
MIFVDNVKIVVKAGDGGNGSISFRHEKFVDKGGPDGGDGGNGGNVVFLATRNENTLAAFRHNLKLEATPGQGGAKKRQHGKSGEDLVVRVPIGTVLIDSSGKILADLTEDNQTAVIAEGGRGGYGNAHFVSSRRQAPKFAEKGEQIEPIDINLEMKMIADVGLIGLPNAGKSTLLGSVSNAKPAIADYPFTTLSPNLGVVDIDNSVSLLFADIPGLIEGASEGKGLGDQFLRHIERTAVLVHLIDVYGENIATDYLTIQGELKAYKIDLSKRPQIIVLNKIDNLDPKTLETKIKELRKILKPRQKIFVISAASGEGVKELLREINIIVTKERTKQLKKVEKKNSEIPVISLEVRDDEWHVTKNKEGFLVTGKRIEQFAARTDFSNNFSVERLRDIMRKMGIMHELVRARAKVDDKIQIGKHGSFDYY